MAQGATKKTKAGKGGGNRRHELKKNKKTTVYAHKKNAKSGKFTKKGNPTVEVRRGCTSFKRCGDKSVTGLINNNIEELMASRVLQAGSNLKMKDITSTGKQRLREVNRNALTKKKTRLEQKLEETQKNNAKLDLEHQ